MVLSRFSDTLIAFRLRSTSLISHCGNAYLDVVYSIVDTKVIYSFCIGVACDAAEQDYSDAQTRALGPWKSPAFKVNLRSELFSAK